MSYICKECPRECLIDREKACGVCGVKKDIVVAKILKNFMWEEPCLCFDKGVTAIFFAGCPLKCEFCQNEKISRCSVGKSYTAEEFAREIEIIDQEEIDGIDLISPTQFTSQILEAFKLYKPRHKVIWNSNGYEKIEQIERASSVVDVFLPDFKYHNDDVALKYSKVLGYNKIAVRAIKKMAELKPTVFDGENMIQGVIARHLILPGNIQDSIDVLEDIKNNFPQIHVSLMSQFLPNGKGDLCRKISPLEYKIVLKKFRTLGLEFGYFQDFESSSEEFVPKF